MLMAILLAITTARSPEVAAKFKREVPMPAKCYAHGAILKRPVKLKSGGVRMIRDCVIDHVKALRCGGLDIVENMQWQTYAESVAKDKTEKLCK